MFKEMDLHHPWLSFDLPKNVQITGGIKKTPGQNCSNDSEKCIFTDVNIQTLSWTRKYMLPFATEWQFCQHHFVIHSEKHVAKSIHWRMKIHTAKRRIRDSCCVADVSVFVLSLNGFPSARRRSTCSPNNTARQYPSCNKHNENSL